MELTKEQIAVVENYLQNRKVAYLDLKVEILDHIVSDIEEFIRKNHTFENALKMTTIKWEKHFSQRSSFYFGYWFSASKIMVNKAVKEFRPFYFLYLTAYFLPYIFLKNIEIQFEKTSIILINQVFISLAFLSLSYVFYVWLKMMFSNQKTTYRFILRTQYWGAIFFVMILLLRDLFNDNGMLQPVFVGFTFAGFAVTYICHHFYKKHQAVVQKFQNV